VSLADPSRNQGTATKIPKKILSGLDGREGETVDQKRSWGNQPRPGRESKRRVTMI
jgi:hypothetical protein